MKDKGRVCPQGYLARPVHRDPRDPRRDFARRENPSTLLHKISEIYDRIAFAGVGKYTSSRISGSPESARGYQRLLVQPRDVTAKALANAYSQALGNIFTQDIKPFEVEVRWRRWPRPTAAATRSTTSSTTGPSRTSTTTRPWRPGRRDPALPQGPLPGCAPLDEALQLGVRALTVTQNKTLSERDLEVAVLTAARSGASSGGSRPRRSANCWAHRGRTC